jgi:predicted MFS family arabinose efflux permease
VLIGLFASVTHVALPIAPDLVDDAQRGRAIGIVMTGLLLGILLARTFAGWVSRLHGWQTVFVVAAVVNAAFVPLLWKVMPKLPPKQEMLYSDAMKSLWTLFRTQPLLRESSFLGALVFASFSCFWTILAFVLYSHYGLGADVAGMFGLVGAAGAMECAVCLLAMKHEWLPPTLHFQKSDCAPLDYVPNHGREKKLRTVMSNSFGFGGIDSCLILRSV